MTNDDPKQPIFYAPELKETPLSDILKYWTPERKRNATPFPIPMPEEDSLTEQTGVPTTDPKMADLTKMPFAAVGKLFLTMDGKDFVASAAIFERNNLLLTAAHCIQDSATGHMAENFVFERIYQPETLSERLTFKTVALKKYWYTEKKRKWDYAFAILNEASAVATPLKHSTEPIDGKTINASGYPANYYNGERMVYITGTASNGPDNTMRIPGCKMRVGCSGGPWVLEDNQTVVGLNAAIASPKTSAFLISPKFDAEFENLYQYALSLFK